MHLSEEQLEAKLETAGIFCGRYSAERGRTQENVGQVKVGMVEHVEKLGPKLEADVLMDPGVLDQ